MNLPNYIQSKGSIHLPMESDLFSNAIRNFFDEIIAELADEPDLQSSIQHYIGYLNR